METWKRLIDCYALDLVGGAGVSNAARGAHSGSE